MPNLEPNYKDSYSPRLTNNDLAPTRDQNWTWYNIFSFWMSDVHSMGGYVVAASFFALGLASWQVLLCLLLGICIVQLCANLVAKPSQMAGVPYAVICRQAFGVFGANIPAVIRGLIAFAWYGIQTYLAANALMLVMLKFWPSLAPMTEGHFLGLSHLGWVCFGIMWVLQALVFWHGMSAIKRFIDIAGPAVYVVMLALAVWILSQTGFSGISFTLASKELTAGEQTWQMITATALVVSYFSGPLLNFGDSRYGKSMQEIRRGNRWGLPFNFLLFSIVTVVIVSGTQSLFGKMITDPIETVSHVGNSLAMAIGLLTMIIATIGINIVANFVSPAFDFSNCSPQKISFRTGGMIAAVGSVLLTPWNLFQSPELIHYTLDVLGSFIGPLFGILLADFYLIKRGKVFVDDLCYCLPEWARYWYKNGINPKAVAALVPSVAVCLVISFIPSLHEVANFSWFIGVFLGAGSYRWIARHDREGVSEGFAPRRATAKE
jgi:NCS1 family nucleobase:cation symporter-1